MTHTPEQTTEELEAVQFPTIVDNWLAAVLVLTFVLSVASVLMAAAKEPRSALVAGLIVLGSFGLIVILAMPTHYTITDRELLVRSGVLHSRIPLDSIRRVYPTRNPLSAPAWSLNRLGIEYRKGRSGRLALISPARREEFLHLLAARAGLARQAEELRRSGDAT